jgi:hypothetical protein
MLSRCGLSVHRHVNQDCQRAPNGKSFLYGTRILCQCLVASTSRGVTSWSSDDDAPHATEVGVIDFQVQNLARDAGNQRIGRTQVNPGADVSRVRVDSWRGKQARVIWREGRDDGISS